MKIHLDKRFTRNLRGRFGKYNFEVGILQDAPHKLPARGNKTKSFAGGPARKTSAKRSSMLLSEVSRSLREQTGINLYSAPFKKRSSDIVKFTKEFFKLAFGRSEPKRAVNLIQAIVRNPILRGDYGPNSPLTAKIKGFNRYGIDTGQFFQGIRARVKVRRV